MAEIEPAAEAATGFVRPCEIDQNLSYNLETFGERKQRWR